jgi:hypothetical protein
VNITAPAIASAYAEVQRSADAIAANPTLDNPSRAALIQAQVLGPLHKLLQKAKSVRPATNEVTATHRACVASLQDAVIKYSLAARSYQNNDTTAYAQARLEAQAERTQWKKWLAGLRQLQLTLGLAPSSP